MTDTYAFSADISQLLSLIINTFYSNKEIFLRELLSNASDALDKIRYQSLTDQSVLDTEKEFKIEITPNKEENTITIRDTGIGMTKNDLINNLGTIAKSGTKSFMEAVSSGKDMQMIGQFGVGFYAAYLVADKVTVYSKHNDDTQHVWESNAGGSFTVKEDNDSERLSRGTKIVLHLKDDMREYADGMKINNLIMTHSEFLTFPIYLWTEKTREEDITEEETKVEEITVEETTVEDVPKFEDVPKVEEDKPKKRTVKYHEFNEVFRQKPIWLCKHEEVTHAQYDSFYKAIKTMHDYGTFSHLEHFSVEGQLEFNCILFVPEKASYNHFNPEKKKNMKLYVRRIFITDEYDFLPNYLSFIVGVVDSADLPLNISREILQENKILNVIKKNLLKRCLKMFDDISKDEEKYSLFYKEYSKNIKLGICEDNVNRDKFIKLLRFQTSKSGSKFISFDDYIKNMDEKQQNIYYISGDDTKLLENSPFIEKLKSKNYEIIFFTDPLDEYTVNHLKDYENKKIICATKDGLKFEETDEEKREFEDLVTSFEDLTKYVKEVLGDKVTKVQISNRLANSPCILVTTEYGYTANMERILKAQAIGTNTVTSNTTKIMELNPNNRIVKDIKNKLQNNKQDKTIKDLIWLLYDTSLIISGFSLDDPNKFGQRIHRMIEMGLDLDTEDGVQLPDVEIEKVSEEEVSEDNSMEQVD